MFAYKTQHTFSRIHARGDTCEFSNVCAAHLLSLECSRDNSIRDEQFTSSKVLKITEDPWREAREREREANGSHLAQEPIIGSCSLSLTRLKLHLADSRRRNDRGSQTCTAGVTLNFFRCTSKTVGFNERAETTPPSCFDTLGGGETEKDVCIFQPYSHKSSSGSKQTRMWSPSLRITFHFLKGSANDCRCRLYVGVIFSSVTLVRVKVRKREGEKKERYFEYF